MCKYAHDIHADVVDDVIPMHASKTVACISRV